MVPFRLRPFLAIFVTLLAANPAAWARCRVVPGTEGEVSTWLVAGPWAVPRPRPSPTLAATLDRLLGAPPAGLTVPESDLRPGVPTSGVAWRGAASPRDHLDVGAAVGGRGPRMAYAAVTLDAATEGDRYLFLGTDDAVLVLLDGREVFRRAAARASRDDDDVVALHLAAGRHAMVVKLVSRGDMDLFARLTDAGFRPDPDLVVELTGVEDAACTELGRGAADVDLARRVVPEGTRVEVTVSYPGGTARTDAERERSVTVSAPDGAPTRAVFALTDPAVAPLSVALALPPAGSRRVTVDAGGAVHGYPVAVAPAVRAALLRSAEVLPPLDPAWGAGSSALPPVPPHATASLPAEAIWSVERTAERLGELVSDGDTDATHLADEAALLGALLDGVASGRDPYAGRHGPLRRAYRSPLDGSLQEYSIDVPPSYRGDRPFPLVVGLHGLHGSAHRMLPVLFGLYDDSESRTHADRHLPPLPDADAILVAPYGHGDSGYRQQGEYDVLRVVEEVRRAYRIDPDRTYITGLSMGGIGAASIPLHHPELFAAAAPLCGYHSYFVRGDTRGVRRPWEVFLMEARSNADWAENGSDLPMYIVQGTHDLPLSNSQVLVDRYQALHYTVESEWPPLGHNVWSQTYAGGRIIPYFLRYRRNPAPRHIRFRTPDLRWRESAWLALDAFESPGHWGEVDLTVDRRGSGRAMTRNVTALTLAPPAAAFAPDVHGVSLALDGDPLSLPVGAATPLVRTGGHWTAVDPARRPAARPHGPIRELYDQPLLFVVGTAVPAEARLNERVARAWARRPGIQVRYPVVRDDSYTEAMGQGRTLVLVGSVRSNRLLARVADRLPVRFEDGAIRVGARTFRGPHAGAVFAAADPDDPSRTLLVIAGLDALGTWRSRSLPDLLPDYVVYDDRVAPARGRVLLGPRASVLAAGFFNTDGAPGTDDRDPVTPAPGGDDD